jgi:hypothetical protein
MPNLKEHLLFDLFLKWEWIISDEIKTERVHQFIDTKVPKHHHILDEKTTRVKVKNWIDRFSHLAYPETLTYYLRVAYGHLVLDEAWGKIRKEPLIYILRYAFALFKERGYNKKTYKGY